MTSYSRREALALGVAGVVGTVAGCSDSGGTDSTPTKTETAPTEAPTETPSEGPTIAGSWPQYGYDDGNTSYAPDTSGPQSSVEQLWSTEGEGTVWTAPTVHDGTVYFGDDAGIVRAVDGATGAEQWRAETEYQVDQPPLVSGGRVVVQNGTGTFVFDAETGTEEWSDTNTSPGSGIALADGTLFLNSSTVPADLIALDAETGTQQWSSDNPGNLFECPAVADGSVYVTMFDGLIRSFDTANGSREWETTLEAGSYTAPTVASVDGRSEPIVYVGDETGTLSALDATDGGELWTADLPGWIQGSVAVADGTVYVASEGSNEEGGVIRAIDASNGTQQWERALSYRTRSSPAVADGIVYLFSRRESRRLRRE